MYTIYHQNNALSSTVLIYKLAFSMPSSVSGLSGSITATRTPLSLPAAAAGGEKAHWGKK